MMKKVDKQMSTTNLIQNQQINVLKPFEQDLNQNIEHKCKRKPYLSILADSHGRNINELRVLSKYLETDYRITSTL